jgi:hypothetical protein
MQCSMTGNAVRKTAYTELQLLLQLAVHLLLD